jgi:hypothetical protein
MDPHIADVLARMQHEFTLLLTIILGMICVTLLSLAVVWWRLGLALARAHQETMAMLANAQATAQAIAAQTRELLRRSEP